MIHNRRSGSYILLIGILAYILAGCANKYMIKPGDTLDEAYKKAEHFYNVHDYDQASSAFQTVLSLARGTARAEQAEYYLAESYYHNNEFLLAANEYKRYYTYYPKSPKREEMQFKEALCYYKLSPRYKLDQTNTDKAIELFQLFISQYPNSDQSSQAGKYIDKLRDKLAHKTYAAAKLYMRNNHYKAAAIYYGLTVDQYPETNWAESAMARQVTAYLELAQNSVPSKQKERYNKAIAAYQKYVQIFPDGKNRAEAENSYSTARDALAKLNSNSSKSKNLTASND